MLSQTKARLPIQHFLPASLGRLAFSHVAQTALSCETVTLKQFQRCSYTLCFANKPVGINILQRIHFREPFDLFITELPATCAKVIFQLLH